MAQPFTHPVDDQAYSRFDGGKVVCTSCHSPHVGPATSGADRRTTRIRKRSPRNADRFEYELCETCHGAVSSRVEQPRSIAALLDPGNPSFHPVKAPAAARAPSIRSEWSQAEVECTDCHGNSDPQGPLGPHGSSVRYILRAEYAAVDGQVESAASYALCYGCHDRERVLDSAVFPEHRRHVVDERASCATCHDPHGSFANRALIRFEDGSPVTGVGPSIDTGRLAFQSAGVGTGSCELSCHGHDHAPATYGTVAAEVEAMRAGEEILRGRSGPRGARSAERERAPRRSPR